MSPIEMAFSFVCVLWAESRQHLRGFPLQPVRIVSHGRTDDSFQSALIDSVALVEVDLLAIYCLQGRR
jgi:hypothetical protein